MTYWSVDPPARWPMGYVGVDRTPIYASCADCGEKDATIAGFISSDGTFAGIGVITIPGSAFVKPAMFCAPCYAARVPTPTPTPTPTADVDSLCKTQMDLPREWEILAVRFEPEHVEEHRTYTAVSLGEALTMAERDDAGRASYTYGICPEDFARADAEGITFNHADGLLFDTNPAVCAQCSKPATRMSGNEPACETCYREGLRYGR